MKREVIAEHFPELKEEQLDKLDQLSTLFREWNEKINLVSRKDIDCFEEHHLLHSLSLAKVHKFAPRTRVLDLGTGGGLPGLPLAICFPDTNFFLLDSVAKKIVAVRDMAERLKLKNVQAVNKRAEELESRFEFVLGRAVASLPQFLGWISKNLRPGGDPESPNGVLYFKGSLYKEELGQLALEPFRVHEIETLVPLEYFKEKYLIHLEAKSVQEAIDRLPKEEPPAPSKRKKKGRSAFKGK